MNKTDVLDKSALIRELETNLWETWSTFGCGPGCALHDEGDVLWFDNPIPIIPYNGILKFQVKDNIDERIDKLIDHFQNRNVAYMWIVHPSSLPRDLPKRLQKRGFKEVELMSGMARSLFNLPEIPSLPDGMEIRKVLEEGDTSEYYSFASWRWGVPEEFNQQLSATLAGFQLGKPETKAHAWQVWHNGQPVAKAGAFFTIGSVGVYGVATKPEARRLGLGSILTLTVLEFAQSVGKNLVILHSSPMAESLYSSLGFEVIANFHIYAPEYVNNFFG